LAGTSPLLSLTSLHDVEISGSGGIDGQGADWWAGNSGSGLYMIYFTSCNTVLVQNVTVSNAAKAAKSCLRAARGEYHHPRHCHPRAFITCRNPVAQHRRH